MNPAQDLAPAPTPLTTPDATPLTDNKDRIVQTAELIPGAITETGGVFTQHLGIVDPYVQKDPERAAMITGEIEAAIAEIRTMGYQRHQPNPFTEQLYTNPNCTMARWRRAIPGAEALLPLYEVGSHLPDGTPIDDHAADLFQFAADARGIRSRAAAMTWVVENHVAKYPQDNRVQWLSLACGAAVPAFRTVRDLQAEGRDVQVTLIDQDAQALDLALHQAERHEIPRHSLVLHRQNVLHRSRLHQTLDPKRFHVAEGLGIFEYFVNDVRKRTGAQSFLQVAYELVEPGGLLVVSNMLSTHPQLAFTLIAIQWPYIWPRSVPEIVQIVREAGIPDDEVQIFLPDDGVYAVVAINKSIDRN